MIHDPPWNQCFGRTQQMGIDNDILGGGFKYFLFHPYLGKWSNLTNIFQMGWNHQPDNCCRGGLRLQEGFFRQVVVSIQHLDLDFYLQKMWKIIQFHHVFFFTDGWLEYNPKGSSSTWNLKNGWLRLVKKNMMKAFLPRICLFEIYQVCTLCFAFIFIGGTCFLHFLFVGLYVCAHFWQTHGQGNKFVAQANATCHHAKESRYSATLALGLLKTSHHTGGGFKDVFGFPPPLLRKSIQFDERILQLGAAK